ncbi:16S rRNA (cytosine(1402)-N(4))-methyltransferase RsmH [Candidatus Spyradosoma sp. SGI.093]|uniref:16S rRNA (cytosine(1402)-N(4))-methyltransferase RsmH n=1 Tax=Candidatus Spyradosoma sp. SGI.093 TaxID=3420583 RepID=UPI003D07FDA0
MSEEKHIPVLFEETLAALAPERGGSFLDCTFGGGGHARAVLERGAAAGTRLAAMDRDPAALPRAERFAAEFGERFRFYGFRFSRLDEVAEAPFDGVLMDIGVSSFQLDDEARGFSFRKDAPADMRMDTRAGVSAAEFLETAPRERLVEAIRDFGEEPQWRRVVEAIEDARGTGTLGRTATLAALIESRVGRRPGAKIHPATRAFQGIRIAVNDELGELRGALPKAFAALKPGGVLAVISFHSLEDRIVKRFFNEVCGKPVDRFDGRPQDERVRLAEPVTHKAVRPSDSELAENPRSRSSRLRALKKI